MKKLLLTSVVLLLAFYTQAQNLPEVFSAINITVKEGHSGPEVANGLMAVNMAMQKHGRGIGVWMSYGDRGERKQKLSWGFTFELKENRDYYFPSADAEDEGAYPQFGALQKAISDSGVNWNSNDITEAEGGYTDFVCVGFDHLINPKIGAVAGVRTLPIKAESAAAYEEFVVNEVYPFYNKNMEGVNYYIYKGDRGEGKGTYIGVWSFDSVDRRNSIFPKEGEGVAPEFTAIFEKVTALNEMGAKFLDADEASDTYTDYIRINLGN
ncbi:MAG: hypothetical protein OEQ53_21755 [Saprospiraceae bacterium]|nr:hypothetical protein [Saprospiraceae bacterium]